jgi:hypothetical protein
MCSGMCDYQPNSTGLSVKKGDKDARGLNDWRRNFGLLVPDPKVPAVRLWRGNVVFAPRATFRGDQHFIASPPSEGGALPAIRRGRIILMKRGEHFASDNGRRMVSWAGVLVDVARSTNSVVGLITVLLNSIPVMVTPTTNIVLFRWLLGLTNRDFRRMSTATSAPSSKAKFADREGASRCIASETGARDWAHNPQTSRRIRASKTVHPRYR